MSKPTEVHQSDIPQPYTLPVGDERAAKRKLNRAVAVAAFFALLATGLFIYTRDVTELQESVSFSSPVSADQSGGNERAPAARQVPAVSPSPIYRLSPDGMLLTEDGTPLPLAEKVVGYVDTMRVSDGNASAAGWAADLTSKEPAARVIVMVDGLSRGDAECSLPRPDVAAALKIPQLQSSGYIVTVHLPEAATPQQTSVRVFAITADGATRELIYPADYPFKRE